MILSLCSLHFVLDHLANSSYGSIAGGVQFSGGFAVPKRCSVQQAGGLQATSQGWSVIAQPLVCISDKHDPEGVAAPSALI